MGTRTILLLGHTGVGKSASGNTILGGAPFESRRSFRSVTTKIKSERGSVGGQELCVVDTPGISRAEDRIRSLCEETLRCASPSSPVVFLLVLKIDRFTEEQQVALRATQDAVGEAGRSKSFLLFTGGDTLEDTTLDQFIHDDPDSPLPELVQEFNNRYHVFNNSQGGQEQVLQLLQKFSRVESGSTTANPSHSVELQEVFVPVDKGVEEVPLLQGEGAQKVRVVLLGLSGVGKSSSGNTILGRDLFESGGSFDPVTLKTVSKSAQVGEQMVKVVDTPGFSDKALSSFKLFSEIMLSIHEAAPGPHVFIIVVRIGRISEADGKLFKLLPKIFRKDANRFSLLLFTHADGLGSQKITNLIQGNRTIQELLSQCGDRYSVFNNLERNNPRQVQTLMEKINEIIRVNGRFCTAEMFSGVQSVPVQIQILWNQLKDWFENLLKPNR